MRSSFAKARAILKKSGFPFMPKFRPRDPLLRNLVGDYVVQSDYAGTDIELHEQVKNLFPDQTPKPYLYNGRRLGAHLIKEGIEPNRVSQYIEDIPKCVVFTVSCDLRDIVRIGETKHYKSCLRLEGAWHSTLPAYCENPRVAVAFTRDRGGSFIGRSLLFLCKSISGENVLGINKTYGNILSPEIIAKGLKSKIPCFKFLDEWNHRTPKGAENIFRYDLLYRKEPWVDHPHVGPKFIAQPLE